MFAAMREKRRDWVCLFRIVSIITKQKFQSVRR